MTDSWKTECRYPDMITGKSKTSIIDFGTFANGNNTITGRPKLLQRIWPAVILIFANLNPRTAGQTKHLLRRFWNFLDQMAMLEILEKTAAVEVCKAMIDQCFRHGPRALDAAVFLSALRLGLSDYILSKEHSDYMRRLENNRDLRMTLIPILDVMRPTIH